MAELVPAGGAEVIEEFKNVTHYKMDGDNYTLFFSKTKSNTVSGTVVIKPIH